MKRFGLFCVAASCLSATSFGAIRAVTPAKWNDAPNCWQMKRHAEKMSAVAKGGAKVVFIGDSITHLWEHAGKRVAAAHLSEGDSRMLNLGTAADRTEHVLWRLENGELDGYEAKAVFLMIGTNNTGHFPFAEEPPADTILGIRAVLDKIRAKQPKALVGLLPIFPRGRDVSDACRIRNEIVNKEIRKFCDGKTIFWIDFNDRFLTADGLLSSEYFPDRLHPSEIGYEIWFAALKPYIDYALSDGRLPSPVNLFPSRVTRENVRMDELSTVYPVSRIRNEGYGAQDWWLDRLLNNRNQIVDSKGAIDLVFFGDSITHNWDGEGREQLAELRKTYSILNIGYSGDRTEHLVWRGENGELDGYKAKCVMLMIGTNNQGNRPEDTAAGVKRVLETIARKQPQAKVLLLPVFPRAQPGEEARKKNEKVNEIIRGYADGDKIVWVDFTAKFLDKDGDVKWIMSDRLHPNAAGYAIWTEAVRPYFKAACGK